MFQFFKVEGILQKPRHKRTSEELDQLQTELLKLNFLEKIQVIQPGQAGQTRALVSPDALRAFTKMATVVNFNLAGTPICNQGDPGDAFFVVLQGTLRDWSPVSSWPTRFWRRHGTAFSFEWTSAVCDGHSRAAGHSPLGRKDRL
mmetsp:Transcript_3089/g.6564  ORF Transcript_3089/g.6564 Transcript_3089/m.6564 type:complete len:145 (+) Transcript_3089:328-762(+)